MSTELGWALTSTMSGDVDASAASTAAVTAAHRRKARACILGIA